MQKQERVAARVDKEIYETILRASQMVGATINQFMVQSAMEKAQLLFEKEQQINLTLQGAEFIRVAVKPSRSRLGYKATFVSLHTPTSGGR